MHWVCCCVLLSKPKDDNILGEVGNAIRASTAIWQSSPQCGNSPDFVGILARVETATPLALDSGPRLGPHRGPGFSSGSSSWLDIRVVVDVVLKQTVSALSLLPIGLPVTGQLILDAIALLGMDCCPAT
jgi:hypothetical protein